MLTKIQTEAKVYKPFDPATAKGIYLSVAPDDESLGWLRSVGDTLGLGMTDFDVSELHCTIVYSKSIPENVSRLPLDKTRTYKARFVGIEWWPGHDAAGYVVMRLQCRDLEALHNEWLGYGCTRTYDKYNPHMTLKKDAGEMPPDFYARKAKVFRDIGRCICFSNATIEGLKK